VKYAVIGSGPSGANAALTLLKRGKEVVLFDVGTEEEKAPHPGRNFQEFKAAIPDPYTYFLGDDYRGVLMPSSESIFDYPPSRNFRIDPDRDPWLKFAPSSFIPVISHNRGGLGVAWGANTLPYDDDDLRGFPINFSDLEPYYRKAAERMTISGPSEDLLSPYLKDGYVTSPPLRLNSHDRLFLEGFADTRRKGGDDLLVGIARMAVDNRPDSPRRCTYDNRCLWGCGAGAIYDPRTTLEECRRYPQFRYRPASFVTRFGTGERRVTAIHLYNTKEKKKEEAAADVILLAAGAISSGGIFLRTLKNDPLLQKELAGGEPRTRSLLDTRVIKIPYLFSKMIGRRMPADDFQFNKLIAAIRTQQEGYPSYIHGEVLSLASLLYHPLIESLPLGSRYAARIFPFVKPALGVVTWFLPDRPNGSNGVKLTPDPGSVTGDRLELLYQEDEGKERLRERVIETTLKTLRKIGCLVSRGRILHPPAGSGIHYAGTIPMSAEKDLRSADRNGRTYAYENLFVADGASFPSLPSKSITFSLMANAIRVAEAA
jgi:choline dehydrogenase-like flavoprotein